MQGRNEHSAAIWRRIVAGDFRPLFAGLSCETNGVSSLYGRKGGVNGKQHSGSARLSACVGLSLIPC